MNWFILQLISNIELQSCIYRRLALMSLAHMAQDNWLVFFFNFFLIFYFYNCYVYMESLFLEIYLWGPFDQ